MQLFNRLYSPRLHETAIKIYYTYFGNVSRSRYTFLTVHEIRT